MNASKVLACALALCIAAVAGADEVILKNGASISGKVREVTPEEKFETAVELFEKEALIPASPEAHKLTADLERRKKKVKALVREGDRLLKQEEYKNAAALYSRARELGAILAFDIGQSLYNQGKYEQAREKLEAVSRSGIDMGRRARKLDEYLEYLKYAEENQKEALKVYATVVRKRVAEATTTRGLEERRGAVPAPEERSALKEQPTKASKHVVEPEKGVSEVSEARAAEHFTIAKEEHRRLEQRAPLDDVEKAAWHQTELSKHIEKSNLSAEETRYHEAMQSDQRAKDSVRNAKEGWIVEPSGVGEVVLKNGSSIKGRIISVTPESLTLEIKWGTMTISRGEIAEVIRSEDYTASDHRSPTPSDEAVPTSQQPAPSGGLLNFAKSLAGSLLKQKTPPGKASSEQITKGEEDTGSQTESFEGETGDSLRARLQETKDPMEQGKTIFAIAKLPEPARELVKVVESQEGHAKLLALQLLSNCCTEESLPTLASCMASEDGRVRNEAARALLRLKRMYPGASVSKRLLGDRALRRLSGEAACDFVELLGSLKEPLACPFLISHARGLDERIRLSAVRALSNFRDDDARRELEATIKSGAGNEVRMWAVIGLGKIGDRSSVPVLIEMLDDKDKKVGKRAASALQKITKQNFGVQKNAWRVWWDGHSQTDKPTVRG